MGETRTIERTSCSLEQCINHGRCYMVDPRIVKKKSYIPTITVQCCIHPENAPFPIEISCRDFVKKD